MRPLTPVTPAVDGEPRRALRVPAVPPQPHRFARPSPPTPPTPPSRSRAHPGSGDGPGAGHEPSRSSNRFLARAALLTAVLAAAGALLGLGRDQALAHLFGAGHETDAFLIAWTVPEVASTLLIEDGLAFVLVPAFSAALARRAATTGSAAPDPVRALVATSLPRLTLACLAAALLLMLGAPHLVALLAPGLPDPGLAIDCTRLTATCVLTFGLTGYCSAALRAHSSYLAPAAIYLAYNVGIITTMLVFADRWGVRSAAVGVAVGGALMVAIQAPSLRRRLVAVPRFQPVTDGAAPDGAQEAPASAAASASAPAPAEGRSMKLMLIAAVLLFALCRQSQVLIERFLASSLPAGAISHLNYAQKVAQLPMVLSLMLATVTFPVVAQAMARGDLERARERVERDLAAAASIVLAGAAVVFACAPQIIEVLFQRGAFTAQDTAATAAVMRVYALGLLGHCLVGVLVRSYFSAGRPTWYPVLAMAVGMVATAGGGAYAVGLWGVQGIAAANALGITLTAVLLLAAMGSRGIPVRLPKVLLELAKPLLAAVCATVVGLVCAARVPHPLAGAALGSAAIGCTFLVLLWALRAQALLPAVQTATRKLRHAR
ncbi:murein biosynthesis integral membrane protein MurJ [Streptomyces apocyni]|uniref:murein biosynthesis integral membrane protein MurJ n=1 Tax=Streptomyces apocyni TaxID=2654677 RepID=UPI0012EA2346|nr:lipid II flippase MurJ [Streptomyces apocyni]